jgi:hypothetical protein
VAGDAADLTVLLLVEAGEIGGPSGVEAAELLLVEMAGDAEAVIPLLGRQGQGEDPGQEESSGQAGRPQAEPAAARAGDDRNLLERVLPPPTAP